MKMISLLLFIGVLCFIFSGSGCATKGQQDSGPQVTGYIEMGMPGDARGGAQR